jgi:inward rectifier potassium channel
MPRRTRKKKSDHVSVRVGQMEFRKVNAGTGEWRDAYSWVLSLSWPRFIALLAGVYVGINAVFALFYAVGDGIEGMPSGSYVDAFFFSVQTLATVGYGHMYPVTLYAHIVTTLEIVLGVFFVAVITGLIFVRFSRPTARIEFSTSGVICAFKGQPTLMIRVANLRHHTMVEAEFRIMLTRDEPVEDDDAFRHFYDLKLHFSRLISFPTALTLRHTIDETSPLHGATMESLQANDTRFVASVVCIETVIPANVQSSHDYTWRDIRFGHRFVDIYRDREEGQITVDYARLHDTEPVG